MLVVHMCLRNFYACCSYIASVRSHLEPAVIYCSFRVLTDRQSSNASLETLLALLQTEGAKIEEDTEVMTVHFNSAIYTHYRKLPMYTAAVQC